MEGQRDEPPAWARRIRRERLARQWSQAEAVRALRVHAPADPVGDAGLLHTWAGWESGLLEPGAADRRLLAQTFGTVSLALFAPVQAPEVEPEDPADLVLRLRSPGLDSGTLRALGEQVQTLCGRYAQGRAEPMLADGRAWWRRVTALLHRRLTLDQHRQVLALAGRLALLIGCLEWDLGLTGRAETTRRAALSLGTEAGDPDVIGWAHELQSWFALTQGDYRTVIAAAGAGCAVAVGRPVTAQLIAQTAKAWARVGARREVEVALDRSRRLLESLPRPEHPGDHFTVDPSRFDLWAMDCYRTLGENRLAAGCAQEVLRAGTGPDGRERSPMRSAAAHFTLAVTAARGGDLEAAVHRAGLALHTERTSLPSLLITARELGHVLERDFPAAPRTLAYAEEVRALERDLLY